MSERDTGQLSFADLVANMSHDLRTPLHTIIGFAELMHREKVGPVSAEHKEYLGDILTSSRHLLQVVNDVLELARLDAGKTELRPETVDLGWLAAEVRDALRGVAAAKELAVEIAVAPEVAMVFVDRAGLHQILYSYLSHAIRCARDGGTIDIRMMSEGSSALRIVVQAGAMEKYQQAGGLALALAKRLVEGLGGRVEVQSTPGQGSALSAILPR